MEFSLRVFVVAAAVAGGLLGASPARALPIFNSASATPDAISPNGDGVQDQSVIIYDVAVDTATVSVVVTPAGGGSPVVTLQQDTRQGRGLYTIPFNGTSPFGDLSDGDYEVRISGTGLRAEGTETRILPVLIDRVPPAILSWEPSPPGANRFKNGDTVVLQACFDAIPDSAGVDLSSLDSGFDPAAVGVTSVFPACLRFTYVITPGNTRPDGSDKSAVVSARDRAGNLSTVSLALCLDNTDPGVIEAPTLVNQSPFFQNGDEIQAEIGFSGAATAGGDFSGIDSGFNPQAVEVDSLGGGRFRVRYRLSEGNSRPDGMYAIPLFGYDADCGSVGDSTLTVTLDNAGANSALVTGVFVDPPAFSPSGNGYKLVGVHFTALTDTLIISVSANVILQNPPDTTNIVVQRSTVYLAGTHTVIWNGSSGPAIPPSRLVDQNMDVILRVTSVALDRQRTIVTPLEVDNVAPKLEAFPPPVDLVFRNGRVAEVPVTFDRAGYAITADFSQVDSHFNPASVAVTDRGGGDYSIFYSVSATNAHPDASDIPILLTPTDAAGNHPSLPIDLVRGCLDNLPPRFVSAGFVGKSGPFKNGDRITIQTSWQTEANQGTPVVTADFSSVDDRFDPQTHPASVSDSGNGVFVIGYTLSAQNGIKTGQNLPVIVTASDPPDSGCGSTTVTAVRLDLDSNPGPKPVFDAGLPNVSRNPTVALSGTAAEAVFVQITVADEPVDTFAVNVSTTAFSGNLTLDSGSNVIRARGIDAAGNLSTPSDELEIYILTGSTFQAPSRFAPGDRFFLALTEPATAVTVRIFSLEGVEIQRLDAGGGDLYRIPWDGRDRAGSLSASGPCLAVLEVEGSGGAVRERMRKAFIFTRKGPGQ